MMPDFKDVVQGESTHACEEDAQRAGPRQQVLIVVDKSGVAQVYAPKCVEVFIYNEEVMKARRCRHVADICDASMDFTVDEWSELAATGVELHT